MTALLGFQPVAFNEASLIVAPPDLDREAWLEVRRQGIGSSDAAAILGEDDWRGPLHVYLDKTGEHTDDDAGEAAYWGTVLEEPIARRFEEKSGIKVLPTPGTLANRERRWQQANVDRLTDDGGQLECKSTSVYNASKWTEGETPARVFVQVQHQLAVNGLPHSHTACLIGGQQFRWLTIERDEEFIGYLNELEAKFWEQVTERQVPDPGGLDVTKRLLERMYGARKGATVEIDPVAFFTAQTEYWAAHRRMKDAELDKEHAGNQLRALLGENEIGTVGGKQVVTWVSSPRAGYTVAPTTVRTLRPAKP